MSTKTVDFVPEYNENFDFKKIFIAYTGNDIVIKSILINNDKE